MTAPRWLAVLSLAASLAFGALAVSGASPAQAQMFRPRTGKGAAPARSSPAQTAAVAAPGAQPTAAKKAAIAAAPAQAASKSPAHAAGTTARRPGTAKAKKKKHARPHGDPDSVTIDDDDDEDVKITDD
jgi:hypothetical protein